MHPNPQLRRARVAGAHAAYLGELQSGALLGESDAELQRELSLLLRTLLLLEPPLRRLHQLVRLRHWRSYCSKLSCRDLRVLALDSRTHVSPSFCMWVGILPLLAGKPSAVGEAASSALPVLSLHACAAGGRRGCRGGCALRCGRAAHCAAAMGVQRG